MAAEITFTGLAKYLGAKSATARRSILRQQKFPREGPMLSYVAAEQRIVSHLVDDEPLDAEVDQSHCREALEAFAAKLWPRKGLTFLRPSTLQDKLEVAGVSISVKPSLLVADANGRQGACKLYFNKAADDEESQLDEGIARRMASLLFHYGTVMVSAATYEANYCSVWCVRDGEIIRSTGRVSRLLADVSSACEEIAHLWPHVTE